MDNTGHKRNVLGCNQATYLFAACLWSFTRTDGYLGRICGRNCSARATYEVTQELAKESDVAVALGSMLRSVKAVSRDSQVNMDYEGQFHCARHQDHSAYASSRYL